MGLVVHCAVCENNELLSERVSLIVDKIFKKKSIPIVMTIYKDDKQFLFEYDMNRQPDVLIIDAEKPTNCGIEIVQYVSSIQHNCIIIMLSSNINYAVEGYEYNLFRFIYKETVGIKLKKAVYDAANKIALESQRMYFVQKRRYWIKIPYKDIMYLRKSGKNTLIHTRDINTIAVRKSLMSVFSELNSSEFIYIDRGCVANMGAVNKIDNQKWYCDNGQIIEISGVAYQSVKQKIEEYYK